jgi:hypothetical protein
MQMLGGVLLPNICLRLISHLISSVVADLAHSTFVPQTWHTWFYINFVYSFAHFDCGVGLAETDLVPAEIFPSGIN